MGILKRNKKKREGLGIGIADHGRKSPLKADEQDQPEQERMTRPDEKQDVAVHQMKEPPEL